MLLEHHLLKALGGALEGLDARNALAETAAAIQTAALAEFQTQQTMPETPIIVPDRPPAPAFASQARALAVRARYQPAMAGRYRYRAAQSLDRGNLVLGQAQHDLRIGQINSPKIVFTNLGLGSAPGIDQEPIEHHLDGHDRSRNDPRLVYFLAVELLICWDLDVYDPPSLDLPQQTN
jgi:hypothetical protein